MNTLENLSRLFDQSFQKTNSSGIIAINRLIKKHLERSKKHPGQRQLDPQDQKLMYNILSIINDRLSSRWGRRQRFRFFYCPGRHANVQRFYHVFGCSRSILNSLKRLSPWTTYTLFNKKIADPFLQEALHNQQIRFTHHKKNHGVQLRRIRY